MSVTSRSDHHELLSLPLEILTQIWRLVLLPDPNDTYHIEQDNCDARLGTHIRQVKDIGSGVPSTMFCLATCPPLLLVNKKVYGEARQYMNENKTILICRPG